MTKGIEDFVTARRDNGPDAEVDLQDQLTEILHRVSGKEPGHIHPRDRLIEDIGIDSLGFYEILLEAEAAIGVKIPEKDLLTFRTVEDIRRYLEIAQSPNVDNN